MPWAREARLFMLHGTTAIPAVEKVPLAMGARRSLTGYQVKEGCSNHSAREALKDSPNSSCHTSLPPLEQTQMVGTSRRSNSSTVRRARTAPLAPVIPTTTGLEAVGMR